uniref:Uncharacterized protein n=1 Tax=Ixodes scapularis TaxID=6945 RepID=A0A4D5SB12_IXOSC
MVAIITGLVSRGRGAVPAVLVRSVRSLVTSTFPLTYRETVASHSSKNAPRRGVNRAAMAQRIRDSVKPRPRVGVVCAKSPTPGRKKNVALRREE